MKMEVVEDTSAPIPDQTYGNPRRGTDPGPESTAIITGNDMIRQVLGRPDAAQMVEVIEKLIAMKNADEDRSAEKEFQIRFSAMQKELPAITPDKQVKRRNGARMYDYASLPYLKEIIDPIAHDHGFSYYWSQADSPDGKMRTIFHLCNCGHERENWFQSEMLDPITSRDGDAVTNTVQAARGTESYQKRATFIDGFGVTILGEDNDASTLEIDEELKKTLAEIEGATSIDDLLTANKKAMAKYNNSPNEITFILGTYAQARKRLTGAQA